MKLIQTIDTHEIYLDHFQGKPVRFMKDKQTGELTVNSDDVARVFGFKDMKDMMLRDERACNLILEGFKKGYVKQL